MKKMFMMMLLSIVSWTGAVTAAEATAPLKSNGPVAQQEAVVADTLNGMTPSEYNPYSSAYKQFPGKSRPDTPFRTTHDKVHLIWIPFSYTSIPSSPLQIKKETKKRWHHPLRKPP